MTHETDSKQRKATAQRSETAGFIDRQVDLSETPTKERRISTGC
jgi:hypothetical protein